MSRRIDLGGGHYLSPIVASVHPILSTMDVEALAARRKLCGFDDCPHETPVGYIEQHPRPDNGESCEGYVATAHSPGSNERERAGPLWTIESEDPLTLSPSILCTICGSHGFVREGRWVGA